MKKIQKSSDIHPNAMEYETDSENYADINQIQIYYEFANCTQGELNGSDKSPILIIHGHTANRFRVHPLFIHLAQIGWPVFRLDLRGHGWSQKGEMIDYSIPTMIDDVDQFIQKIILEKFGFSDVILCGHSMGGLIVQGIAVKKPAYLRKLILLATCPYFFEGKLRQWAGCIMLKQWIKHYDRIYLMKKKEHIQLGLENFPQWSDKYNTKGRVLFPSYTATIGSFASMLKFDLRNQMDGLEIPTLIVIGDQDKLVPTKSVKWLKKHLPNSNLAIIPDCVHNLIIHKPLQVNEKIDDFLKIP